jgi:hypothetical protein
LNNHISILPNYISKQEADALIELLNEYDHDDENWGSPCFPEYWAQIGGDPGLQPKSNPIPDLISRVTKTVSQHFADYGLRKSVIKGHKHPFPASTPPNGYKDYAAILYLNDEYKGGHFIMPAEEVSIKLDAGTLIIFRDAGSAMAGRDEKRFYGVSKIEAGTRYSITFTFYAEGMTDILYD